MKPEETKILAGFHKPILADPRQRQEQQREQPAQTKYGNDIREWFRPKPRKAAQELYPRDADQSDKTQRHGDYRWRGTRVCGRAPRRTPCCDCQPLLPWLPSGFGIAYSEEHVYRNMLGPLGSAPTVACECLFINPIADVAVVGVPDTQTFSDEADATVRFWNTLHRSELLRHRRRPAAFFLAWKGNGLDARSSG
jgi:hypothetical protein